MACALAVRSMIWQPTLRCSSTQTTALSDAPFPASMPTHIFAPSSMVASPAHACHAPVAI
ncbi:MAG: hypothetical protein ACR2NB_14665 [Solirubrobacteraceae bacterium]